MHSENGAPRIMVVDDQAANIRLLERVLERRGYAVQGFLRAREAIEAARRQTPDLILLDINMPEMNGFEACTLLKQEPALAAVPVIFLSGLSDTAAKMEAFRRGGVDYVSKPFELEEVHARVDTHLKLATLQNQLRDQNVHLEAMVEERTRELAQAHAQLSRLDHAKSEFLHMISHELRTPLNGLLGAAELLLDEVAETNRATDLAGMLFESRERILSLVDSALLLTQIETEGGRFQAAAVRLDGVLAGAAQRASRVAETLGVCIQLPWADIGWTTGNRELLVRAWQGLLETAARLAVERSAVTVAALAEEDCIALAIETTTGAIPADVLPRFFHLFGISEASTAAGHLGLEPAMAKRILFLWGGTVEAENREGGGVRITVRCPRASQFSEAQCSAVRQ